MSFARYYPTWWGSTGGGGGSGTVTTVSVTTANGVSGSVANPTTTPAITLTLGDITPTSVTTTNGATGTKVDVFKTTTGGGANTEFLRIDGGLTVASEFTIKVFNAGTGVARALSIYGGNGLWLEAIAGSITLNAASAIAFRTNTNVRWNMTSSGHWLPNSANAVDVGGSGTEVRSGYFATSIVMSSAASLAWSTDANIVRSGAGNLALQNGASGCRWDVHNTTGANAEFGSMYWTTNVLVIGTDKAGSGTARALSFMIGGASKWQINTSFHFIPISDNSFDFGTTTARIRNCYIGTALGFGTGGNAVVLAAEGTGILQLGTDAGTPVTQRIKAFDGSGTSIQGSTLELCGGQSTGNVVGGSTVIKGSPAGGASNSTPNAYVDYITVTGAGDLQTNRTITAGGTTGAQTINKMQGSVNFAAAATSLVVTNSLVTASSTIILTVASNDTTMKSAAYVAASGSFTIYPDAAPTAETRVNFLVLN